MQRLTGMVWSLHHLGRTREAIECGNQLIPLAARMGNIPALSFTRRMEAMAEFARHPDLDRLEAMIKADLDANTAVGLDIFVASSRSHLSVVEFFRGNWDRALESARESCQVQAPEVAITTNLATLFHHEAYAGNRETALALFDRHCDKLPRLKHQNPYHSWVMLIYTVEGLAMLGEREQAAALYPLVCELILTGAISLVFISRFPQTAAGIAAAAERNWAAAEDHFRIAREQAESFPNQIEQIEIRRFRAMMLLDRAARGDRETARELLREALESYTRIGMRRHVELTQALIHQAAS